MHGSSHHAVPGAREGQDCAKPLGDYEKILTDKFGNDLEVATLIRCFLPVSRQHLELNLGRSTTHKAVGEALTTYEQITSSWRTTKVLKQTHADIF